MSEVRHFTAIVVGDNPSSLMKPFNLNLEVEPYVAFSFKKANEYRQRCLDTLYKLRDSGVQESIEVLYEINRVENMSDSDYYLELTSDYDLDETSGDVILTKNPNGRYNWCRLGKDLSLPLINKNGEEVFQARKCDVDWSKVHGNKTATYEAVWDLCVGGKTPETEIEKRLYENMKDKTAYFKFFGDKDTYVKSNTYFWGFAFVDENGWTEMEDGVSQIEWINNFYDRFIKNLSDNALISVYECSR